METFGQRVARQRGIRELTQVQLAKESGLKQSDVSKIERGTILKTTQILGLAKALQCDPDWLLTGKKPNPTPAPSPMHLVSDSRPPYTEPAHDSYTQAAIKIFEDLKPNQREGALAALRTHVGHLGLDQNSAAA